MGPGFKLILPESNNYNQGVYNRDKEFKFSFLSFEIENGIWLAGLSMTEYPHKYQCNQL